jgi:hypothetical protein
MEAADCRPDVQICTFLDDRQQTAIPAVFSCWIANKLVARELSFISHEHGFAHEKPPLYVQEFVPDGTLP